MMLFMHYKKQKKIHIIAKFKDFSPLLLLDKNLVVNDMWMQQVKIFFYFL